MQESIISKSSKKVNPYDQSQHERETDKSQKKKSTAQLQLEAAFKKFDETCEEIGMLLPGETHEEASEREFAEMQEISKELSAMKTGISWAEALDAARRGDKETLAMWPNHEEIDWQEQLRLMDEILGGENDRTVSRAIRPTRRD